MWNDAMIRASVTSMNPIVYIQVSRYGWGDIQDSQIQPASLDVRLGPDFLRHPDGMEIGLDEFHSYPLDPGDCVLGSTLERLDVPDNVVVRVEGKSSLARKFITIHSAGFVDPGFGGDVTLEIKNDGLATFRLKPGMLIAQLSFQTLDAPAVRPYGHPDLKSHYQYQTGPKESSWRQ